MLCALSLVFALTAPFIPDDYDASLPPSESVDRCAGPTEVEAQLYVTKLHSIDERKETIQIECYFRLFWNDHRLSNRTATGCAENRSHMSTAGIWVPDFYFDNALKNTIAANYDGQLLRIDDVGNVFWSTRARLELHCTMDFWLMPFDTQECPVLLGLYRSFASQVTIRWREPALQFGTSKTTHWRRGEVRATSEIADYDSGSYSTATAHVRLTRKTSALLIFAMLVSFFFVLLGYSSFFIAPAAVPARVANGFICFLMVINTLNAVRREMPSGLSVSGSWLLLFMFYCMLFDLIVLLEFAALNFGQQVHAANEKRREERKKKKEQEDSTRGISVEGVDVQIDTSAPLCERWMEQVAKCRHLDVVCRWLFPLLFILGFTCVLLPLYYTEPFVAE